MLTFGSLFAGIGGFDLGLERAGLRCEWQVKINPFCRRVLAKHWPEVRRHDDVRTFPPEGTEGCGVDLICGGPPCQRTSVAAAIQGVRTGETLWPLMCEVVRLVRPAWVLVEQPSGNGVWEQAVADGLAGAGYQSARLQLSARRSGAPHRRRRVLVVAHALRERCDAVARLAGSPAAPEQPWPAPPRGAWRSPGSGNRRVDDGVSGWVDRLRAIGNAVVPQEIERIGRAVVAVSELTAA